MKGVSCANGLQHVPIPMDDETLCNVGSVAAVEQEEGCRVRGGRLSFTGADTASISLDYSGRQFNWTYYFMQ
jgi:hypothetical protein